MRSIVMPRWLQLGIFVLGALALAKTVDASVITFSDRTSWTTAVGSASWTVNFNGFVADTLFNLDLGPFSLGTNQLASVCGNFVDVSPFGAASCGLSEPTTPSVNGSPYALFLLGTFLVVDLTLDAPVSAWGADYRAFQSASTAPLSLKVELYLQGSGSPFATLGPAPYSTSAGFFGFNTTAGEQIGTIRFFIDGANNLSPFHGEFSSWDNIAGVTAGSDPPSSVTEPATLLLIGGPLALALRRRLRHKPGVE